MVSRRSFPVRAGRNTQRGHIEVDACAAQGYAAVGAAKLRLGIEAAGLKGHRIGGAEVSEKHANFIINRDQATATDIEELIEHVRHTVLDVHGIELRHEVRIVGELPA